MDNNNNTVFSKPTNENPQPPSTQQPEGKTPVTLNDLYGPSSQQAIAQENIPPQANVENQQVQGYGPVPPATESPIEGYAENFDTAEIPPPGIPLWKNKKILTIAGVISMFLCLILVVYIFSANRSTGLIAGNATITYWGLWEDSKTVQSIINDFQRKYPTIKVEYTKMDNKKYKERLLTRAENGVGPDIFTYHNSWTPTLKQILLPLSTDVIAPEEFKKAYFPIVQKDLVVDGAMYGIPQGVDTLSLFINKDMFESAGLQIPQTWDDFIKAAKTLTVKDETGRIKTAGAAIGTVDNIAHFSDIVSLLFLQEGVTMEKFTTYPNNIANALTFYTAFAMDKDNVWDDTLNPSPLAFAQGEVAMMFGYSWDIFQIKAANPTLSFEIYPVPNLPGRKTTIGSYWVNGISNKSKYQKESLLFMNYLSQKEVQQKLYSESAKTRLFGTPYARTDLAKTLSDNQLIYPFVQQAENAQSTPFASDTKDALYSDRLNAYLGNAVRSILTGGSASTAVDTLIQGVTQVQTQAPTQ
jgi:multiple sugar transport system substrate-binding protein